MNIDAAKLKGILDCMDVEADERDKHSAQIRDIVKKAKSDDFETKALRKVWQRRRMDADKRQYEDDLLDIYEHALGAKGRALRAIEGGEKVGKAAEANGVHRATLARSRNGKSHVAKQPSNATPHDADGVVTDTSPKASDASSTVTARATDAAPQACVDGGVQGTVPRSATPQPAPESGVGAGTDFKEVAHELVATTEPEVARVVPPATEPVRSLPASQRSCAEERHRPLYPRRSGLNDSMITARYAPARAGYRTKRLLQRKDVLHNEGRTPTQPKRDARSRHDRQGARQGAEVSHRGGRRAPDG